MAKQEIPSRFWDDANTAIKVTMTRNRVSYADLCTRLQEHGITFSEQSLRTKISRKGYDAGFFLMILESCGERLQGGVLPAKE